MRIHETACPFFNTEKYIHDFVDYWQEHAMTSYEITPDFKNQNGFYDKISVTSTSGEYFINTDWKVNIEDHTSTKFPFKMGRVSAMRLQMNKLATLENTPRIVKTHFNIEKTDNHTANNVLSNLEGCPERVQHLALELAVPVTNLRTGLVSPVETIWIDAPSIESFEGLNVPCVNLSISLTFQKSISGIHKQLKNVRNLQLYLPRNFSGGLLGLALIPGLQEIRGLSNEYATNSKFGWNKALEVIQTGKSQGKNVHDIQEDLIDAGLTSFATL